MEEATGVIVTDRKASSVVKALHNQKSGSDGRKGNAITLELVCGARDTVVLVPLP
jgi:hypothetical protein